MTIKVLADRIISQIAAGEVVERPSSVVKELIENSLDAGATVIHVSVTDAGRSQIRISDNGSGIRADDTDLAIVRHATSKLEQIEELDSITTLGFRGEALSSISSVSRMTITTRHRDEDAGVQIYAEGGEVIRRQTVGAPAGSVIVVDNLFYNTPARLKFLKKEKTEKRAISSVVSRYAFAYPAVRFTLEMDGRETIRVMGTGKLSDVIVRLFGVDKFKQMVAIQSPRHDQKTGSTISISGFVSTPEYHRSDRAQISLFINGRWIQDTNLTFAVVQAYHEMLPAGRFPIAIVNIEMRQSDVDVNVHPAKAEVRFRDANAVFAAIQRTVRQALVGNREHPNYQRRFASDVSASQGASSWGGANEARQFPLSGDYRVADSEATVDQDLEMPEGASRVIARKKRTLPMLRIIGQVGAMYIVAEGPAGLYLVDQHQAHQRVLYEQLLAVAQEAVVPSKVSLSTSHTVPLSSGALAALTTVFNVFKTLGFDIEEFGGDAVIVRAAPSEFADRDVGEILGATVDSLISQRSVGLEDVILALAESGAVRSGQILSDTEMRTIVSNLEYCESPKESPSGDATLIYITGEQLLQEFKRG